MPSEYIPRTELDTRFDRLERERREDYLRLESKIDKIAEAVNKLVLVEERQTNLDKRLTIVEGKQEQMETRLNWAIGFGRGALIVVPVLAWLVDHFIIK